MERRLLGPLSSIYGSGVIHLIGHIFMMQMDSFNFGFDSGSRVHFRSESVQRFIILIKFNTLSSCPEIVSVHWKLLV